MADVLYREDILANRLKWVDFLERPETKKATGILDIGGENRCCLGHGAFCLGVEFSCTDGIYSYGEAHEDELAPDELLDMIGLWDQDGGVRYPVGGVLSAFPDYACLTVVNDNTDLTPQEIGAGIREMINGGDDTPFQPLTDYASREDVKEVLE